MISDRDFLALVEAAGDLDDIRTCHLRFRKSVKARHFARVLRTAADGDAAANADGRKELEAWASSGEGGGLKLRDHTKLPEWAKVLRQMLAHFHRRKPSRHGSLSRQLAQPATAYARAEIQRRLQQERSPLPAGVLQGFEKQLEQTLTTTIRSCLEFNLKAFTAAFRCVLPAHGELSREEIEREFIGEDAAGRLILFLQSFPAVAKVWSQLIADWIDKISELGLRLRADGRAIRQSFFRGRNPGDLVDVTMDLADRHRGGRETIILHFRNGRVVYKPRSGHSESDWFSLVRWVNRKGFAPKLRTLRVLRRPDYCWMEFIEHRPCGSELGAHRYYRRAGGLICAAYLLRAVDCHRDNLIAAGDQPVLIDMETLLHGTTADASREHGGPLTQTSLLPIPSSLSGASDGISAFGGTHGRHTPSLAGSFIAPSNYCADVERGFWEMWKIIGEPSTKTGAAFRRRVRRLGARPWRRMHRSTRSYYEVRERSLGPEALRSGLARSRRITLDLLRPGVSASVILEEMSAIGRFDIPYFLSVPSSDAPDANYSPLSNLLSTIRSALVPA